MPTFELSGPDGGQYHIDAPDEHAALAAFSSLNQPKQAQSDVSRTPDGRPAITIRPNRPEEPVTTNNVVRSAARGIPVVGGVLNRLNAATNATIAPVVEPFMDAGPDSLKQPDWLDRYNRSLEIQNSQDERFDQDHPLVSTGAQIAGGVAATIPLAATATGARLLGLTGQTLPQQIVRGAASNAAVGAADAVTRGENPLVSGGVGMAAGALAPPIARGVSMAAAPVATAIRGIRDPQLEAARRVAGALDRDITAGGNGLSAEQFVDARRAGIPVTNMEVGGETTRALARSAANTSPEGRQLLNDTINDRFESQGPRTLDWLQQTFNYPNAITRQEAIDSAARATNKGAYQRAYREGDARFPRGIWSPELERLTSSPDIVEAMQAAAKNGKGRAVADGSGGFNPGVTFENGILSFTKGKSGVPSYPDLQFWDYTLREMRDSAKKAARAGADSQSASITKQANALRSELDSMVPAFNNARSTAAAFFGAENALEAGQNFVTSRLGNREAQIAIAKMTPAGRKLFQDGFVDRLVQHLNEVQDRRSVVSKIIGSPAARERLTIALGPDKAREIEARLHVEQIMDLARNSIQGNSTTARQLVELGLAGGSGYAMSGGNLDPQSLVNAALVYGALKGRTMIDRRVAQNVARLLVSDNPVAVANAVKVLSQPKFLGALRITDANLASIAARGGEPAAVHSAH